MDSTLRQVRSIISLPAQGLMDLCHATGHAELILSGKEWQMLNELYNLLAPFEEATNLVQAAVTPTLEYVVPAVLALNKHVENDCKTMKYLKQMGKALKTSLWKRFLGIFQNALMTDEADFDAPATTFGNSEAFGDPVYFIACTLDPRFSLKWLMDVPINSSKKELLKKRVKGMIQFMSFSYV